MDRSSAVADALSALGIRRLALAIHDASLPSGEHEDIGRGSPGSDEATRFFAFVRAIGFDAIQLGPEGETSLGNPSPYDATWFSRSVVSLAWSPLVRGDDAAPLLDVDTFEQRVAAARSPDPTRTVHRSAYIAQHALVDAAHATFRARLALRGSAGSEARALAERLAAFTRRQQYWLDRYALYDVVTTVHGCDHSSGWPVDELDRRLFEARPDQQDAAAQRIAELITRHAERIERYAFGQLLAHEQHARVRAHAHTLGLRLLADLQIGASDRDHWAWPDAFFPAYRLGAPPSRTNPDGQPWGYPLLDPAGHRDARTAGPSLRLFTARLAKAWDEFDGLRIDHPHGLVDPWVYRADDRDPLHAVQHGTRLFSTPACVDHPALAAVAIARTDDLNPDPDVVRWADDWVLQLDDAQVDRYATLVDVVVATARERGCGTEDIACEVLSTLPHPVARVLVRHGLGRFRVTQKADPHDPHDVYRSENAAPEDWIMVGTHDTRPLWQLAQIWLRDGSASARAARLAERLAPDVAERARFADAMARDASALALGHLAELFASPARQVMVFFADAFGLTDAYNEPGTTSEDNWTLRLPASWREDYAARLANGRAMNLPRVLAIALRARGLARSHAGLVARLDSEARALPDTIRAL